MGILNVVLSQDCVDGVVIIVHAELAVGTPTDRNDGTTMFSQSLRSASRPLLRTVAHRKPTSLLLQHRNFTQTRVWRASEDVSTFSAHYQNTALFKKLADKPAALAALNDFAQILKDEGSSWFRWFRMRWVGVLTFGFRDRHRPHKRSATFQDANVQTSHELKVQGWCEEGCY